MTAKTGPDLSEMLETEGDAIQAAGHRIPLSRGEVLIRAGEPADTLYFLLRGRLSAMVEGREVAEIAAGEPVGEVAFLTGGTRTADVVAARDGVALALDRPGYDALVAERPEIGRAVARHLALRLGAATARLPAAGRRDPGAIVLLPVEGETVPERLAEALARHLSPGTRLVTSAEIGEGSEEAIAGRMLERQSGGARAIYAVQPGEDAFARAAIRQSDLCVTVAPLGAAPRAPAGLEAYAATLLEPEHRLLVLTRPAAETPIENTCAWLAGRALRRHHHVALDAEEDAARLARFLEGRARGLVMGGGGALGTAHIGVLRALHDAGIAIDAFGGASVGGAMAVAFGSGMSPAEVMDRTDEIFVRNKALGKLTVPYYSVLDHENFDRQLRENYGTRDLADFPIPVFAASTSLTTNALHLHKDGPAWEAVRASGSLPMALPPFVAEDGEVLLDGGLIDNLPIAAMRDWKEGPNLVVSLAPDREYRLTSPYAYPGKLRALASLVTGRRPNDLPPMMRILSRAMVVTSRRRMARTELGDDVLLEVPPEKGMSLLSWKKGRAQEARAYDYARARIEAGALQSLL